MAVVPNDFLTSTNSTDAIILPLSARRSSLVVSAIARWRLVVVR
jgi:hypothetical protein